MTPNEEASGGGPRQSELPEDSLHLLEFPLIRERLAAHTGTSLGRELALTLAPSTDRDEVARRQQESAEARLLWDRSVTLELAAVKDLRPILQRAALGGVLSGEELRDLGGTLKAVRSGGAALARHGDAPVLGAMARGLPEFGELEREIASSIGASGEVLDGASPALRELRSEARTAHQHLMESMERAVRRLQRQNVLQEPIITQRNGRMVLLVKTEMKQRVSGIVHDVSDSGATLFMEPYGRPGPGQRLAGASASPGAGGGEGPALPLSRGRSPGGRASPCLGPAGAPGPGFGQGPLRRVHQRRIPGRHRRRAPVLEAGGGPPSPAGRER